MSWAHMIRASSSDVRVVVAPDAAGHEPEAAVQLLGGGVALPHLQGDAGQAHRPRPRMVTSIIRAAIERRRRSGCTAMFVM